MQRDCNPPKIVEGLVCCDRGRRRVPASEPRKFLCLVVCLVCFLCDSSFLLSLLYSLWLSGEWEGRGRSPYCTWIVVPRIIASRIPHQCSWLQLKNTLEDRSHKALSLSCRWAYDSSSQLLHFLGCPERREIVSDHFLKFWNSRFSNSLPWSLLIDFNTYPFLFESICKDIWIEIKLYFYEKEITPKWIESNHQQWQSHTSFLLGLMTE